MKKIIITALLFVVYVDDTNFPAGKMAADCSPTTKACTDVPVQKTECNPVLTLLQQ